MIRVSRQMGDTISRWKTCLDAIVESPPELPGELRDTARRITQHHQAKELMEVLTAQIQTVQRDVDLVEAVAAIVLESGESDRYIVQRLRRLILRPDELMKVEDRRPGMRCERCSEIPSGVMLLFQEQTGLVSILCLACADLAFTCHSCRASLQAGMRLQESISTPRCAECAKKRGVKKARVRDGMPDSPEEAQIRSANDPALRAGRVEAAIAVPQTLRGDTWHVSWDPETTANTAFSPTPPHPQPWRQAFAPTARMNAVMGGRPAIDRPVDRPRRRIDLPIPLIQPMEVPNEPDPVAAPEDESNW